MACAVGFFRDSRLLTAEKQAELVRNYAARAGLELKSIMHGRAASIPPYIGLLRTAFALLDEIERHGCRDVVVSSPEGLWRPCYYVLAFMHILFRGGVERIHIASTGLVIERGEFEAAAPVLAKLSLAPFAHRPSIADYFISMAFQPASKLERDAIASALSRAKAMRSTTERMWKRVIADVVSEYLGARLRVPALEPPRVEERGRRRWRGLGKYLDELLERAGGGDG